MRILMVPLAALASTMGSQNRVKQLMESFIEAGFEVATCAAKDLNYKEQEGITNFFLETPIPMGLPSWLGKNFFQLASKTGLSRRKTIHSFDEVLFLTGAINEAYFRKAVACVRKAIRQYQPDIVYSEFNLSAIVAAKVEGIRLFTNYSYPVQPSYAASAKLAKGIDKVLEELSLPTVNYVQELFSWAEYQIVPSSYELEPILGEKVIFTGPFDSYKTHETVKASSERNKILAYMGSGTITNRVLINELQDAFKGSKYEVYIAASGEKEQTKDNIHIASFIDFKALLPEAAVLIHHGGQNSMMDALRFGVPQLICPGKVFERKYNGESIAMREAGIVIDEKNFMSSSLKEAVTILTERKIFRKNSERLWQDIKKLGGAKRIINIINSK